MKISVSILDADYLDEKKFNKNLKEISIADQIHFDVMDGFFVKNKTFDYNFIKSVKTNLEKDVHLMIDLPENVIDNYIDCSDIITFHFEATKNTKKLIDYIKSKNKKVGLSIKPETNVEKILNYLGYLDRVLIMSVEPGMGGQYFQDKVLEKIEFIRRLFPSLEIAVDGGINSENALSVVRAGADVLISGSYVFKSANKKKAIELLRKTNL